MEYYTPISERNRKPTIFEKVGRTKSEFKESCDINHIMKKYQSNGILPITRGNPLYDDFSSEFDYQDAQNLIIVANQQFADLPANIRKEFENDPKKFLEFVGNPENEKRMVEMGLKDAPIVVKEPVVEEPVVEEAQ